MKTITRATAKEWLKRISYKPNFRMWIDDPSSFFDTDCPVLHVEMLVPDARGNHHGGQIPIQGREALHLPVSTEFPVFVTIVRDFLLRMEKHEMDEWFRIDGVCVKDPHPEDVHHSPSAYAHESSRRVAEELHRKVLNRSEMLMALPLPSLADMDAYTKAFRSAVRHPLKLVP